MHIKEIVCGSCNKTYKDECLIYRCDCGGGLSITYDIEKIKEKVSWKEFQKRPFNHWRYEEFYPYLPPEKRVSLGEGGTPLISARESNLFFKLESCNPTGSFKDRGSTLEISHALQHKAKSVVCASTGNMGASIAAYCARAGLLCEIILPKIATLEKLQQIRNYQATITRIEGDYTKAAELAQEKFRQYHDFLAGDYSFRGEGEKSVGFEIIDEMQADAIICPMGNGTLISSIWKGLKELNEAGLLLTLPRLVGVQAEGCSPIVDAFNTNSEISPVKPNTIASAISCGNPLDGKKAVNALNESKGIAIKVDDKLILDARRKLAKQGIDGEPSGIAGYAGYEMIRQDLKGQKVVCVICGHGLKDLTHI